MSERKTEIERRLDEIRRDFEFASSVRLMRSQLNAMYNELEMLGAQADEYSLMEAIERLQNDIIDALRYGLDDEGNYRGKSDAPGAHTVYR